MNQLGLGLLTAEHHVRNAENRNPKARLGPLLLPQLVIDRLMQGCQEFHGKDPPA
jgi:hypothetical protein